MIGIFNVWHLKLEPFPQPKNRDEERVHWRDLDCTPLCRRQAHGVTSGMTRGNTGAPGGGL